MSIQDAYTNWSATYDEDRNRTRDLDQQVTYSTLWGQHVVSIVETGCGTGKNTALLAEIGDRVTALDFSAGMLARAREKVQAANVTFVEADLTQVWPVEDCSADLVVCNLGDMLDRLTAGRYRSNPHRVRNAAGADRISLPFFLDPGWDAHIEPITLPDDATWVVPEDRAERWDRASLREVDGCYGAWLLAKVSKVFPALAAAALPGTASGDQAGGASR